MTAHTVSKAMILAAGHGTRMRPLTDHTPKPLLKVGGKSLLEWHLEKLAQAGFREVVINIAWLGWQIPEALGDGSRWGLQLHYSDEQKEGALETAGGILKALPLLDDAPFWVVNGDVWCDYPYQPLSLGKDDLAHIVLVDNPPQHPQGDFVLEQGRVLSEYKTASKLTFSGIGLYRPALFAELAYGSHKLAPLLRQAMQARRVSGEHYRGQWQDIGTPQRLREWDAVLQKKGRFS